MKLERKLGLMELEQRIAPATTITLTSLTPGVTDQYSFTEVDGDHVLVQSTGIPDGINHGHIYLTDNGAGPFDSLDSITFDGLCVQATTLSIIVDGVGGNGGAEVGIIDASLPGHLGTISLEGNVIGAPGVDSIVCNDVDYLHIYSPRDSDGGAQDLAILGDVSANGTQTPLHIQNNFDGHVSIEGAIHNGGENGILIDGTVEKAAPGNGVIDVGDMTGKVISQINNNIALQDATININGNSNQSLNGNLSAIHTEGSIIGTKINIHGNLDASGLASSHDVIATDWDGNGIGTIFYDYSLGAAGHTVLTMTNGGNIIGSITNNEHIYSGSPYAINDTEDLAIDIVTHGGNIDSSSTNGLFLMSGGSLAGSIDTTGSDGYIDGDIVACKNIGLRDTVNNLTTPLTIHAGNLYHAGYEADFYADGEYYLHQHYSVPLPPGTAWQNDGTIGAWTGTGTSFVSGLDITISGDIRSHSSFNNDFVTTDFDGDNTVSSYGVSQAPMVFTFHGPNTDFDATVVSGSSIGNAPTIIDVGGDFGGIITASGNIDLLLTAGSATGGGLGTYGYIQAGDTNVSGSVSGSIVLNNGDAQNFDVSAYDNITASFDISGSVDKYCQWTAQGNTFSHFQPTGDVHIGGDFAGQILTDDRIDFHSVDFKIDGNFSPEAKLWADTDGRGRGPIVFLEDAHFFLGGDFEGAWLGSWVHFDDSWFDVDGNFTGSITTTYSDGFLSPSRIFFENGSKFYIDGDMTGTIATFVGGGGDIDFESSKFFIHNFSGAATPGPQGTITADHSFIFNGGPSKFRVDEFDGKLVATTGVITIENVSNASMIGDFSIDGVIQAQGDITFENGAATMDNFAGRIESIGGDIKFTDFDFIVTNLFSGDFFAKAGDIIWDPSVFSAYDYSGTWIATDITFDPGSTCTVEHLWYDAGLFQATTGDIEFTATQVFIEDFEGKMIAGTDFIFDFQHQVVPEDADQFHTEWFFGTITAGNDITFENGIFDFGQFMPAGKISAANDLTFTDTMVSTSYMDATVFSGDLLAGTDGTGTLAFSNLNMELDIVTDESLWKGPNGVTFDNVTLTTEASFEATVSSTAGNIEFTNSMVDIGTDFLGLFTAKPSGNIDFTDTNFIVEGDFGGRWLAGGDINFDPDLFAGDLLLISEDFTGLIQAQNITFTNANMEVGGNFSGTMKATTGDITFDPSNMTVGGNFSGKVEAYQNLTVDGEVIISGAFTSTGLWKAEKGDMSLSLTADTFVVDGAFNGLITAGDNLEGEFEFNYDGVNYGRIIANASSGLTGILSGTLESVGSWAKLAPGVDTFSGAGIDMDFDIGGNSYSNFTATYTQGITGDIDITGNFGGKITSAGGIKHVFIGGTFINDPVVWNLSAVGTVVYFDAYALGAGVNMKAAHWDTLIIGEGGMDLGFGIIQSNGGAGSIDSLTIMGPHPEGPALPPHIDAVSPPLGSHNWKISESAPPPYLAPYYIGSAGQHYPVWDGSDVFIKAKNGTVQVDYYNTQLDYTAPGHFIINEIRHIIYESGKKCDLSVTATAGTDLPAIGLISAPLAPRPGYITPVPTSFQNITVLNLDVSSINITGNANDIKITNGDLDFLTVGDENYFQGIHKTFDDKAVGNLKNLTIKNGSIGSLPIANIQILSSLSGKIIADEIMGTIELGSTNYRGKFGTIQSNGEFDATVTVYGNLKSIIAKNDYDLDVDITVHGKLGDITMPKARFTSHVQCELLQSAFDVYDANGRTVTYGYQTTSAQYTDGGVLTVFDLVPSKRIH